MSLPNDSKQCHTGKPPFLIFFVQNTTGIGMEWDFMCWDCSLDAELQQHVGFSNILTRGQVLWSSTQLDVLSERHSLKINLSTNREGYKNSETTVENVSKKHLNGGRAVCKLIFCDLFFTTSPKMAFSKRLCVYLDGLISGKSSRGLQLFVSHSKFCKLVFYISM